MGGIDFGVHFGSFLDRLLELFGIKRSPKCHQKSMRKMASKKVSSEDAQCEKAPPQPGARRGVRGEVNLRPGGRRFGTKEERKKRGSARPDLEGAMRCESLALRSSRQRSSRKLHTAYLFTDPEAPCLARLSSSCVGKS